MGDFLSFSIFGVLAVISFTLNDDDGGSVLMFATHKRASNQAICSR